MARPTIERMQSLGLRYPARMRVEDGKLVFVGARCPLCNRTTEKLVTKEQLEKYFLEGALMRDAFDHLTDEEIETLLTGIHPGTCQGEESIEAYVNAICKLQDRVTAALKEL